jgi:arginine:ornithine antiporter/lysine permease
LLLAFAMLLLTRIRPDLDGGIFTYAREGFGELIGFCSAWGYWLCAVIANVSYLVIVFSALSFFTDTPELRCLATVIPGSPLWVPRCCCGSFTGWCCAVCRRPPASTWWQRCQTGSARPVYRAGLYCVPSGRVCSDFTGIALGVPVWEQVKNTMLITLWVFIGVEGAVVVSARARNKRDVGRATLLAVLAALGVYLLVTLLSLGVVARPELAEMRNPSMAGLMVKMLGLGRCGDCRRADCFRLRRLPELDHHGG